MGLAIVDCLTPVLIIVVDLLLRADPFCPLGGGIRFISSSSLIASLKPTLLLDLRELRPPIGVLFSGVALVDLLGPLC